MYQGLYRPYDFFKKDLYPGRLTPNVWRKSVLQKRPERGHVFPKPLTHGNPTYPKCVSNLHQLSIAVKELEAKP